GSGGILVVGVGPDPAGLDRTASAIGDSPVTGPDAGTETVQGVVGDLHRIVEVVEGGDRQDRAEDLLLEDPHAVVALEDGWRHVVTASQISVELGSGAAGEDLGALILADL